MKYVLVFFTALLFFTFPIKSFAVTWLWVDHTSTNATTDTPAGSYGRNGEPKVMTNVNSELDQNLLDNFYGMVPEGQTLNTELLSHTFNNLSVKDDLADDEYVTVKVAFLNEGAGYRNALGYFIYETANPPQTVNDVEHILIFPNSSKKRSGGVLQQGDQVDLKIQLTAGKSIGFFVNSNGWSGSTGYQKSYFSFGQPFYTLTSLNPTVGLGNKYHVIFNDTYSADLDSGADSGFFAYGFEDIRTNGGDKDYNDLIFNVEVTPISAIKDVEQAITVKSVKDSVTRKQGVLAFEDNWPMTDDYDFNDAVLSYQITQTNNGDNENNSIRSIVLDYDIKALGAMFHNGLALSIPGLHSSQVESITLNKTGPHPAQINSQTASSVQVNKANFNEQYDYPLLTDSYDMGNRLIITLSENLFEELSTFDTDKKIYNTQRCLFKTIENDDVSANACPSDTQANHLKLTINFKTTGDQTLWVNNSMITSAPFDHFLFGAHKNDHFRFKRENSQFNWFKKWLSNHGGSSDFPINHSDKKGPGRALEIHLKHFDGTQHFESSFTTDDTDYSTDAKTNPHFISKTNNLPWALDLPVTWLHPKERVDMNYAYPNFINWLQDPSSNANWYENNVQSQYLYQP